MDGRTAVFMKWDEQAERLRRKAVGDEEAMSALLAVSSVPDEVIGFHAHSGREVAEKRCSAAAGLPSGERMTCGVARSAGCRRRDDSAADR